MLLQRYRDAKLAGITTFRIADGLSWRAGRGTRTETDLRPWLGKRGQAGHTVPRGFPLSNRFRSIGVYTRKDGLTQPRTPHP